MKTTLPRQKKDKWFIVLLAIMLYSLVYMFVLNASLLPYNWGNFRLWVNVIALALSVYGDIWVFRIYLSSIVRHNKKIIELEEKLVNHPDIKKAVEDILK